MKQKSVTLVEIVVSMVILSLILLGIAGIFVAGKRHLKRAQYKQEALNFAREKLEDLEALDFEHECLLKGDYPQDPPCDDGRTFPPGWGRTWKIEDEDLDADSNPDRKNITLKVEWPEP
jgi:Tfp pilus assembly protein PilV